MYVTSHMTHLRFSKCPLRTIFLKIPSTNEVENNVWPKKETDPSSRRAEEKRPRCHGTVCFISFSLRVFFTDNIPTVPLLLNMYTVSMASGEKIYHDKIDLKGDWKH